MGDTITELKSLILGQRIEENSAGNAEISGSLAVRIAKTLIYGEGESDTDLEIDEIKDSAMRFRQTSENGKKRKESIQRKRDFGKLGGDWKLGEIISIYHVKA